MRIISKHKDYYDRAMQHGQDQSVVFVRDNQDVEFALQPKNIRDALRPSLHANSKDNKKGTTVSFKAFIVVFCGKLYRGVHINRKTKDLNKVFDLGIEEQKAFYDYAELSDYLGQYDLKLSEEASYRMYASDRIIENCKSYLSRQGTNELYDFAIENRYVVLTSADADWSDRYNYKREITLTANGFLDKFQFYRVMDAFTTYQEIDMFVSGTLPQSTAMPITISDKDRIQQHGFDKYSFRKPKQ